MPPPPQETAELASRPISREPISDDLMLERQLRTQIRVALGASIRELDVRVAEPTVNIRTQASRFWQKRAIQRYLESLPMPEGYQARIVVE